MEQAYGFTPTHTEHKIISYSAYQISENVKKKKSEQLCGKQKEQMQSNCLLKPLEY